MQSNTLRTAVSAQEEDNPLQDDFPVEMLKVFQSWFQAVPQGCLPQTGSGGI